MPGCVLGHTGKHLPPLQAQKNMDLESHGPYPTSTREDSGLRLGCMALTQPKRLSFSVQTALGKQVNLLCQVAENSQVLGQTGCLFLVRDNTGFSGKPQKHQPQTSDKHYWFKSRLLQTTREAAGAGPSIQVLTTHVGDPDEAHSFWLQPGLPLAVGGTGGVSQRMEAPSFSPFPLSTLPFQ